MGEFIMGESIMGGLRMDRAEARRGGGRRKGKDRPVETDQLIRLKNGPISDEHALAFVRDHARDFGILSAWRAIGAAMTAVVSEFPANSEAHGPPAGVLPVRVGLSHATYLATTRGGLDPLTAIVYQPDVHGVCTLREVAQVTVVDLPVEARLAPLYWAVPDNDGFLVGRAVDEFEVIAGEKEQVIVAAPFAALFAVYSRLTAEALFRTSAVKPQRLWPVAHEGSLEFMGQTGEAGFTAATLAKTLAFLPYYHGPGHEGKRDVES